MDSLKDQTAIVGIGWTEFSKSSGRTEWSMATEAAVKACADAGIAPNQINGIVRSSFDAVLQHQLVKSLGIDARTGCLGTPGNLRVVGSGRVNVYQGSEWQIFNSGDKLPNGF